MNDKPRTGEAYLAIGADGAWNLCGWGSAKGGKDPEAMSATAADGIEHEVWRLHKVTFSLPAPPMVEGEPIAAQVEDPDGF